MKCARCGTTLDDGVMVCSNCGAVVGMTYAKGHVDARPVPAPKQASGVTGPARRGGTTKGLVERVRDILTSPRAEWSAIAAEPVREIDVWLGYVVPLALIGPVALAIAQVVLGTSFPMVGVVKAAPLTGIAAGLLTFAFTLVQVALLAWAVNAIAHRFQAAPDRLAALQVIAYSMTPIWLVGILYLVPPLAFLWVFAAAYAWVLCLFGLRALMRCSPQQSLAYAFTTLGIGFALWLVMGAVVMAMMGFGPMMLD